MSCAVNVGLRKLSPTYGPTALPADDAANTSQVRQLNSFGAFFAGDEQTVVRNYARARYEAASWLASTGRHTLYQRLARMQGGESFAEISAP